MTSAHRALHDLYRAAKLLADPGDAGTITVIKDLQVCEMVTGSSGETRTLTTPTKAGIQFVLRLKTDGGGDAVVTASAGLNVALNTVATFADAGDQLVLISVSAASGYRWEILVNTGSVGLA